MNVEPGEGGAVRLGETTPSFYPYASNFGTGANVTVEAIPASGYRFDGWSGDLSGSDNPASLVITCNKNIIARFSRITYALTIEVEGHGSTNPAIGTSNYEEGTEITITAIPDDGWQFARWNGDVSNPDSVTTTVTMDGDKTFTAEFSRVQSGGFSWWIIVVVIAGVMIAGFVIRLVLRRRMA